MKNYSFSWPTHLVHGFNTLFTEADIGYYRLNRGYQVERTRTLCLKRHNELLLTIEPDNSRNIVTRRYWGSIPDWWESHPKFTGIPIYFIRTSKLQTKYYYGSKFCVLPIKHVILKEASAFRQIWPREREKFIWCIGITVDDKRLGSVSLLQKDNEQLITIPEQVLWQFFRHRKPGQQFSHLIREELKRYISEIYLDKIATIDQFYYD